MVMTMSLSAGREEGTARLYTEFCTRGLGSWPRPRDLRNVDHKTGYPNVNVVPLHNAARWFQRAAPPHLRDADDV